MEERPATDRMTHTGTCCPAATMKSANGWTAPLPGRTPPPKVPGARR